MELTELLVKRRSVRDYEDKKVPLDLITHIINDSIKAPNAGNMQLWRFTIVNNKEYMRKISDACKASIIADIEKDPNSPMKRYEATLRDDAHNVFYNAPAVVYIAGTAKSQTISVDCALCAAYFMLSAVSRGLGTCWVAQGGMMKDREILNALGLSENYRIIAPIILGYPKNIPVMAARKTPKILKIIE